MTASKLERPSAKRPNWVQVRLSACARSWPMNEPASREGARGEGQVNSGLLGVD